MVPISLTLDQLTQDREREEKLLLQKQKSKFGRDSEFYKQELKARRQEGLNELLALNRGASWGYKDLGQTVAGRESVSSLYARTSYADRQLLMPKPEQPKDEKVPDLGSRLSRTISSLSRSISGVSAQPEEKEQRADSSATGFRPPSSRGDLITLKIVLKYLDCTKQELDIAIHKSRDVQDVHQRTTQWLCEKFHFQPQEGQ